VFYLLTLPVKILFVVLFAVLVLPFAILFLPFLLLRLVIKAAVVIVVLPFVFIATLAGMVVAFFAVCLALLVPLLPIAFLVLCVWAVVRAARPSVSIYSPR